MTPSLNDAQQARDMVDAAIEYLMFEDGWNREDVLDMVADIVQSCEDAA